MRTPTRNFAAVEELGFADSAHPNLRLRWQIEELRVSLFAQKLKAIEPVSPKRLNKRVEDL